MHLSCSMMLCVQQSLALIGGATESIFPQVEALLLSNTDYQDALQYVASRKNMDRYRSMMDFLFCELFPEWKASCFRFYENEGPALREQISIEEILHYNNKLLKAMDVAIELFKTRETEYFNGGWKCYRQVVLTQYKAG